MIIWNSQSVYGSIVVHLGELVSERVHLDEPPDSHNSKFYLQGLLF